jgi:hypothetical protein
MSEPGLRDWGHPVYEERQECRKSLKYRSNNFSTMWHQAVLFLCLLKHQKGNRRNSAQLAALKGNMDIIGCGGANKGTIGPDRCFSSFRLPGTPGDFV